MKIAKLLCVISLSTLNLHAGNWLQAVKAVAGDRGEGDNYGFSVDIDKNYAIVGAPYDFEDKNGGDPKQNAGSAYILKKNSDGTWSQMQKITASDRSFSDRFGYSVAIYGKIAVIGAIYESEDANMTNTSTYAGSVYIFELNGSNQWVQKQKIVASDREDYDQFGYSVAIDDSNIVVGSPFEDHDEFGQAYWTTSGSAYVFKKNGLGVFTQIQKIVSSDRDGEDIFGTAVAIHRNHILIGAPGEDHNINGVDSMRNSGSAYVFKNIQGSWQQINKITSGDRWHDDQFGISVSIYGNNALVGTFGCDHDSAGLNFLESSGSAYLFSADQTGSWKLIQNLVAKKREAYDNFGYRVGISANHAVIGAYSEDNDENELNKVDNAGSAYVYSLDAKGKWVFREKIVASDREDVDLFGISVAIDGNQIIAGAYWQDHDVNGANFKMNAGSAYVFKTCVSYDTMAVVACNQYESPSGKLFFASKEFTDTINNYNGCDSLIKISLVLYNNNKTVSQNGAQLSAMEIGATYQWLDCDDNNKPIPNATSKVYTATKNGNYRVLITKNNCTDSSVCVLVSGVGVFDYKSSLKLEVYPNPSSGLFEIKMPHGMEKADLRILDITGKVMFSDVWSESETHRIDLSSFLSGIYILEVNTGSEIKRVILVKSQAK